jgi:hypothetical protein
MALYFIILFFGVNILNFPMTYNFMLVLLLIIIHGGMTKRMKPIMMPMEYELMIEPCLPLMI